MTTNEPITNDSQSSEPGSGAGSWPPPWEPPLAGSETEHILGALNRLRATFRYKADGLEETGLRTTIASSTLSLASLLKHVAAVEDYYSTVRLRGGSIGEPWTGFGWDGSNNWEFESAVEDPADDLYALYDGAVARARSRFAAALEEGGLEQLIDSHDGDGNHASLRRMLCDLIEEYGRHVGHADLLREAVDGRIGEDPPLDWTPQGRATSG